ncbi:amino acid adenylation domain-containing protein [Peribacillus simplex]|uniref:amino acid adenylation domain-containing protein n=1 Tax=Peribacillus simplex TaxID=1478 RepID=UPI003D29E291
MCIEPKDFLITSNQGINLNKTVIQQFEDQVKKRPQKIAVRYQKDTLTYQELNIKANQLANAIKCNDIKVEEPIAICLDKSIMMIVSILGVIKAGCYYVPLDPSLPDSRLNKLLKTSTTKMLISDSINSQRFEGLVNSLNVEEFDYEIYDSENLANDYTINNLIYSIFTSGTTGEPKGVQIEHKNVLNHLQGILQYMQINKPLNYTLLTTIAADLSITPIFGSLTTGGTLHIIPGSMVTDAKDLSLYIKEYSIDCIKLVPSHMDALMYSSNSNSFNVPEFVILGGEQLRWSLVNNIKKLNSDCKIFNHYGPTEVTVGVMANNVDLIKQEGEIVPLGEPYGNSSIILLDKELNPVKKGQVGEIYISGLGVSRGYFKNPTLTKERFKENWFKEGSYDEVIYKTGDLARFTHNNQLEFVSRVDHQVKVRGYRVELSEIEAHLYSCEDVRDGIIVSRKNNIGETVIRAIIVHKENEMQDINKVREYLKARLPEYMVPQEYLILDTLPLNKNGKIDRQFLSSIKIKSAVKVGRVRNETEGKLVNIWMELFELDHVSIYDSFFDLGGNSLNAIRLSGKIREIFQVDVSISTIFLNNTIEKLAKAITLENTISKRKKNKKIRLSKLQASSAQKRLWFWDKLGICNHLYNIPYKIHLKGDINYKSFGEAIDKLCQKHEILRTRFLDNHGEAEQEIVAKLKKLPFQVVNISHLTNEREIELMLSEEGKQPFALNEAPLFSIKLFRIENDKHILFINFHHIISDDWSLNIFLDELFSFYNGKDLVIYNDQMQYQDFTFWHEEFIEENRKSQLSYWSNLLKGNLNKIRFPGYKSEFDRSYEGDSFEFEIPSRIHTLTNEFAKHSGSTLFMTLMSVFQALIHKYTDQEDIIIGAPVAGRSNPDFEKLIGFFVNTLPWRSQIKLETTFRQLLLHVQKQSLSNFNNTEVPFEDIVNEVRGSIDQSLSPIINVMFAFQNTPKYKTKAINIEESNLERIKTHTSKYDITLFIEEKSNKFVCKWEYKSKLFNKKFIEQLSKHFINLLQQVITDASDVPISTINMLDTKESNKLIEHDTVIPFPQHLCLHELFEKQAIKTPNNIAVVYENESITYKELDEKSNSVGNFLKNKGVHRNDVIALCMDRSINMIVGLLGILKAGGAYLPIEVDTPRNRVKEIVNDSNANLVLINADPAELNYKLDVETINLQRFNYTDYKNIELTHEFEKSVQSSDLVSVYYTSGSTGKPKGVANTHEGWVNRMCWMQRYHHLKSEETVLQKTTLSFDDAAVEIFWPLMVGAKIALIKPNQHKDPRAIIESCIKYEVAVVQFVPSMLKLVLDLITKEEVSKLNKLRIVVSSGEALTSTLVKDFFKKLNVDLFNSWGATEASIDSTCHKCSLIDTEQSGFISVGTPIDNNFVYILDKNLNPVPHEVEGDLYIGGIGVAKGYLNDQEKTSKAFIDNPFLQGQKMYKTGDRGYFLTDGNIMFQGREDNQIKIRGMRVELGEIENTMRAFKNVKDAFVLMDTCVNNQHQRLVGYIIKQENFNKEDFKNYLDQALPNYMIPQYLIEINEFPLNKNGKLDHNALPKPTEKDLNSFDEYVEPNGEVEIKLVNIWRELLGINNIGVKNNFFQLGGHSLLGVQVISKINEHYQIDLKLSDIFETPVIKRLAYKVKNLLNDKQAPLKELKNNSDNGLLPLSYSQERLWFLNQLDPNDFSYNLPFALRIKGPLNVEFLLKSFERIIQKHDILRSNFKSLDGKPYTVISPFEKVKVDISYISDTEDEEDKKVIGKLALENMLTKGFDLQDDCLFRVKLIQFNKNDNLFLIVFHHSIIDGWSLELLEEELFKNYITFSNPKLQQPTSDEIEVSYVDYAKNQIASANSKTYQKQLDYWKSKLGGDLPRIKFPLDYKSDSQELSGNVEYEIPKDVFCKIKSISKHNSVTPFITVLSIMKVLIHRITGQEDLVMGTPVIDRPSKIWEKSIGLFLNTIVLRSHIQRQDSFIKVIDNMKKVVVEAFMNQDIPFERIVEAIQPERSLNSNPIFDIMVNYINYQKSNLYQMQDLECYRMKLHETPSKFLMTFYFVETENSLKLNLVYQNNKVSKVRLNSFVHQFGLLCEDILDNPEKSIGSYTLVNSESKINLPDPSLELSIGSNNSFTNTLKQSIENNLNNIAIEQENTSWSYRELLVTVNEITNMLKKLGLKRGQRVALYGNSSFYYIATMTSLIVNGYVFVPIGQGTPLKRAQIMIKEAGVNTLLDISDKTSQDQITGLNVNCVRLAINELERRTSERKDQLLHHENIPEDSPAYLYFTSGSTGKPKGILGNHKGLNHFLTWQKDEFEIRSNDRFAQFTNTSFDVYLRDIFLPLISGATICIPSMSGTIIKQNETFEWLKEKQITVMHTVPSLVKKWLELSHTTNLPIRISFFAGEPLTYDLVQKWKQRITGENEVVNLYGPTETTLAKSFHRTNGNENNLEIVPIGKPISNSQLIIVNDEQILCGVGEPGEILIRTPYKTDGYINSDVETFHPNPFGNNPKDLVYFTGDRGRYHSKGYIEYLGRKDYQAKINGVRIDLNEIEFLLNAYSIVQTSAVTTDKFNDKTQLVCYLVLKRGMSVDELTIRKYLLDHLPVSMIPNKFIFLNEIPLNSNGKINRKALPSVNWTNSLAQTELTETERRVAQIWKDSIGFESQVTANDDFFVLGGHSLLAIQVIIKVNEEFGVDLKLKELFENSTIQLMAQSIEKQLSETGINRDRKGSLITRVNRRTRITLK